MDNVWEDDLFYGSCQYAATTDNERFPEDSTYTDELYLRDDLRYQYQKEFGLNDSQTQNMKYSDAYNYADAVYSSRFEQLPTNYDWNSTEIGEVNNTQVWALINPFTDQARKLMISKLFEKPINEIKKLEKGEAVLPYRLYSAHDSQVGNILQQLVPSYNYTYIKYASNIFWEVRQQANN